MKKDNSMKKAGILMFIGALIGFIALGYHWTGIFLGGGCGFILAFFAELYASPENPME